MVLPNGIDYEGTYKGLNFSHYLKKFETQAKEMGLSDKQIYILKQTLYSCCQCETDETLKVIRILNLVLESLDDADTKEYDFYMDHMGEF
ncbi:hypothetical protein [Absicoccus porci]|uniref:hypothetical protein n=1 Tax=Absicoccus porci TaxID=2486576 RepID=UPI002943CBBA|nr:hypothetical protein [Absicoccus porci]